MEFNPYTPPALNDEQIKAAKKRNVDDFWYAVGVMLEYVGVGVGFGLMALAAFGVAWAVMDEGSFFGRESLPWLAGVSFMGGAMLGCVMLYRCERCVE